MNPHIREYHTVDPDSGALLFHRSPEQQAADSAVSKSKALAELLAAVIDVLPKTAKEKLPTELMEAVYGSSNA